MSIKGTARAAVGSPVAHKIVKGSRAENIYHRIAAALGLSDDQA